MDDAESSNPLRVMFTGPAKNWNDAAPIGNGRLGAMVWGGVASELIQLNEDTLWTGNPGNYTNPDAVAALLEVRKLVDSDKFPEATAAAEKLFGDPTEVYQLLGDLKLEFDDSHVTYSQETYCRELDLDTATVKVKYSVGGVEYSREHFASFPDQVIVTKLLASQPGSLSFMVSLDSLMDHHSYVSGESRIIMEGTCPGERIPPPPEVGMSNDLKGIQFCAVLDLRISDGNGTVSVLDDKKLKVEGSDWAVLLLVSASSFDGPLIRPSDSKKDPKSDSILAMNSIRNSSYSELYTRHLNDYQKLFQRVSLQLWKSSDVIGLISSKRSNADRASTADRVKSFVYDEDPSMIELLFQFGRYLLISCSRPGSQVANLQGIWNKDLQPKWEAAPHLNINLQMNYWPSLPCNLAECQEPLFDFISSLSINGAKTAEVNYGAGGWVVHHDTDIWAKSSPIDGDVKYSIWPMGGAWLCTHLWEYYCYTLDEEFLKSRAYPLLEGCASFLLDWLIEGPDGYLETNPSTSPEHNFIAPDGKLASVSYSSTMDIAIINEAFSAFAAAAEFVGTSENEIVKKVREARTRLRPTKIARDCTIMEWALEFKDPEPQHRHLSHLFGLFPGHTITTEENLDLCKAAENSLYKRGEDGPGWSTSWKIALWARLHDSEHAYRMVKHLFTLVDPYHEVSFRGGLYSNLFAAHPPFQIDANFGFTAAIAEMLVQSTLTDLYLLPALPEDKWGSGCISGLQARGGVTVNIHWKDKNLHKVDIWSKHQAPLERFHYKGASAKLELAPGKVHTYNAVLKLVKTCLLQDMHSS